jgi:hypothetical protein
VLDGYRVQDFRTLGGTTATLGGQWSPVPAWILGAQLINARDALANNGLVGTDAARLSSDSALATAVWQRQGMRTQLGLIGGSVQGQGSGAGGWFDVNWSAGNVSQNAGAFRVDPNLNWGVQTIVSDAQGGYYNYSYQSRRWQYNGGVDQVASVSGQGASTTFVNNAARYQLSRDVGIGGIVNLSESAGLWRWSVEAYEDLHNFLGTNRLQLDMAKDASGRDSTVTLNEGWDMPEGSRLSTSLAVEQLRTSQSSAQSLAQPLQDHTAMVISAYGGGDLGPRWSVDGNIRWARAIQGVNAPAVSVNVAFNYQISPNWAVLATYYESRFSSWNSIVIASPLAPPSVVVNPASSDRGIFLTLRYRHSAGQRFAPLGGRPGTGWGTLSGTVYLDANRNDTLDAGETGVPNINVILDGRYQVRTDAQGRYEFPAVAAGHHTLTVMPDNLPLPWVLPADGHFDIVVETRHHMRRDIGARRPNDSN